MRLGVAHHFGWAVVVAADTDHSVVDRRRIELVEPGVATAPIHSDGKGMSDDDVARLVADVRASSTRACAAALDEIVREFDRPVQSVSLRAWPVDFPTDIGTLRQSPWEARADSVMYRVVLADEATRRGWRVHTFDAKTVEATAATLLGASADDLLLGPRKKLGPPWNNDHRIALAATVLAAREP